MYTAQKGNVIQFASAEYAKKLLKEGYTIKDGEKVLSKKQVNALEEPVFKATYTYSEEGVNTND